MNQVVLIGRISNDLDLKWLPNSQHCKVNFNLAVNVIKKKDGSQDTDFIPVEVWNKLAENLVKFQSKGSKIAVHGRIAVDSYQDQQGNKKSFTKVIASEVEYLESANKPPQQQSSGFANQQQSFVNPYQAPSTPFGGAPMIDDSMLPF